MIGQTVTRQRGSKDLRTGVWTVDSSLNIEGCMVDFSSTTEAVGTEDAVVVNATVYLRSPVAPDVVATDRILIGSRTFDVVGDPAPFNSPSTGQLVGTVIRLVDHRG